MDNDNLNKDLNSFKKGLFQKVAIFILAIFGILIMVVWSAQFKTNMQQPFNYSSNSTDQNQTAESTCANGNCADDTNLKLKDTDGDGLTDWDEINIYNTSPYLDDSDSDGVSDGQEIKNNEDPNCPSGENCFSSEDISADTQNTGDITNLGDNNLINPKGATQDNKGATQDNSINSSVDLNAVVSGQSSASDLRKALTEAGMDADVLNQLSDEDLMNSYKEVLNNN